MTVAVRTAAANVAVVAHTSAPAQNVAVARNVARTVAVAAHTSLPAIHNAASACPRALVVEAVLLDPASRKSHCRFLAIGWASRLIPYRLDRACALVGP